MSGRSPPPPRSGYRGGGRSSVPVTGASVVLPGLLARAAVTQGLPGIGHASAGLWAAPRGWRHPGTGAAGSRGSAVRHGRAGPGPVNRGPVLALSRNNRRRPWPKISACQALASIRTSGVPGDRVGEAAATGT